MRGFLRRLTPKDEALNKVGDIENQMNLKGQMKNVRDQIESTNTRMALDRMVVNRERKIREMQALR